MKHILFVFFFMLGFTMPAMVYAQANGGVHTITRGGGKTKPSNNSVGSGNNKKKKTTKRTTTNTTPSPKKNTTSTTPSPKTTTTTSTSASDRERILNNLVANMIYVEGGTFTMGGTSEQGSDVNDWEKWTHQVTLSSFSIGKFEVTQEEWEAVMGSNPSRFKGAKRPVERVSWDDCQTFIRKLNQLTGHDFRLPTEAEWEYAARGGRSSRGYKYAGTTSYLDEYGWYEDNSGDTTHPVGQKNANELGLYDMSGNVWEWCADWDGIYSSASQTNPQGPSSGSDRVIRGGGYSYSAWTCRVSCRFDQDPSNRYNYVLGLRLALSPKITTTTTTLNTDTTTREITSRDRILNNLVANMVYVEGGSFTMGATSEQGSDAYDWEKPAHQVTLSSFSIGKYEVTQEEWEAVMGTNPSPYKGAKYPVVEVSREDCQTFILILNQLTGRNFRLPTEAEWEYAARGGRSGRGYKYAGTTNNLNDYAWYKENSGNCIHPVGQKNANELGLYDMSGNVSELCADWGGNYSSSPQTNPKGTSSGSDRAYRGGGYNSTARDCSVSSRSSLMQGYRFGFIGLRLAL